MPVCVPFRIATTYAPSLKYRSLNTLMSKCFHNFEKYSLTHVVVFINVLKPQQFPFEPQFGLYDLVTNITSIIMRVENFGSIKYWKVWETH